MNPHFAHLRGTVAGMALGLASLLSASSPSPDPTGLTSPVGPPAVTHPAKWDLPEQYHVLLNRNIFCRPSDARAAALAASAAAVQHAQTLILRGVVRQEDGFVAIFEDPATSQVQRIHMGDVLGGSIVSRITLRGVELTSPLKLQAVAVGENVAGEMVVPPPVVEAQAAAPAQAPAETNTAEPQLPTAVQANAVIRVGKPGKGGWKVN